MAHVYRPEYTRPVPAAAGRCTHRGRPAVRWKGRGKEWVYGILSARNPSRCRVRSAVWHVAYTGPDGGPCDAPGFADRAATEALMADLVRRSARIAAGLLPAEAAAPRATLTELLAEWGRHLADAGRTAKHARDRPLMAGRVADAAAAARPADLTPAKVVRALAALKGELGLSGRSATHHLSAAKQFTRWLALVRKSEATDHLSGLKCKADETRPTFARRALTGKEFDDLLGATSRSPEVRYGLTGRERAALYLTAGSTGLRASELAALVPESFDLAAATVTALAATAKGRKLDELPLTPEVVRELRPRLAATRPGEPVWPHRVKKPDPGWSPHSAWWKHGAEMVRRDLAAAGIAPGTAAGVFDFHSLRTQFATDLERAGVPLASAQRLMRHSTPALTSKHYIKRSAAELAGEVAKIRRPSPEAMPGPEAMPPDLGSVPGGRRKAK